MKARTVWWVTCLDCRRNGVTINKSFDSCTDRLFWRQEHMNKTRHDTFAVWERVAGLTEQQTA